MQASNLTPRPAELAELRLALIALLGALSDRGPIRCASVIDEATRFATRAPGRIVKRVGPSYGPASGVRFGAARALDSLCAACGLCARGAPPIEPELLTACFPPDPPG